jgi:hypothetical protein
VHGRARPRARCRVVVLTEVDDRLPVLEVCVGHDSGIAGAAAGSAGAGVETRGWGAGNVLSVTNVGGVC